MMLAARGAFLAARRKPKLPYDAEVEYLESTGTQWIDTGVTVSGSSHIVVKMSGYDLVGKWMFGARQAYLQSAVGLFADSGGAVNSFRFAWGSYLTSEPFTYTTKNVGVVTINISAGRLTITRENIPYTYTEQATTQAFTTPCPLVLFVLNNNGNAIAQAAVKIHGVQIDDVRNLVPVRFTNEQGQSEGAMYDRANPTVGMNPDGSPRTDGLYRNRGTGAFTIGPDKAA